MKKILLAKEIRLAFLLLCGACCCMFAGCEDTREDYLDEFHTRFYFRNSGEQSITLFKVGENTVYEIPICKSGHKQDGTGKVTVLVMDQEQLDIYNLTNLTNYKQLPSNLFKFLTEREFYFESEDSYKVVRVELNTDKISELQEADPESVFVLALQVYSDGENTLSPDVNRLFIAPTIDIVRCTLNTSGIETHTYTSSSPVENTISNSVRVNIDNRWDFTCGLGVYDQEWLDAYNEANGTSYELLPAEWYTFPSSVAFAPGRNSSAFDITLNRSNMELLKEYLLPIYITDCTKEQFVVDEEQSEYLINVRLDPDQIALSEEMISSPYTSSAEGSIAELCDGDIETYWHAEYNNECTYDETYGIYIDFALEEPLSAIVVKYCTRNTPFTTRNPTSVIVGVSNDGENWTVIGEVTEGLETAKSTWNTCPAFYSEETFTYVRFGITSTGDKPKEELCGKTGSIPTYYAEIELYGANLLGAN